MSANRPFFYLFRTPYVPKIDEMKKQSSITQLNLLRKNIREAIMMFMVWGWSCESWIDEWSLLLTEDEIKQAQVSLLYCQLIASLLSVYCQSIVSLLSVH